MKLDGITFNQFKHGFTTLALALTLFVTPIAMAEEPEAETYAEKWGTVSEAGRSLAGAVWDMTKHTGKDVAEKGKKALDATKDLLSRERAEDTPVDGTSI